MIDIGNADAATIWKTVRMDGQGMAVVLVIETQLRLHPDDPKHDKDRVNELLQACVDYYDANRATLDGFEILQIDKER